MAVTDSTHAEHEEAIADLENLLSDLQQTTEVNPKPTTTYFREVESLVDDLLADAQQTTLSSQSPIDMLGDLEIELQQDKQDRALEAVIAKKAQQPNTSQAAEFISVASIPLDFERLITAEKTIRQQLEQRNVELETRKKQNPERDNALIKLETTIDRLNAQLEELRNKHRQAITMTLSNINRVDAKKSPTLFNTFSQTIAQSLSHLKNTATTGAADLQQLSNDFMMELKRGQQQLATRSFFTWVKDCFTNPKQELQKVLDNYHGKKTPQQVTRESIASHLTEFSPIAEKKVSALDGVQQVGTATAFQQNEYKQIKEQEEKLNDLCKQNPLTDPTIYAKNLIAIKSAVKQLCETYPNNKVAQALLTRTTEHMAEINNAFSQKRSLLQKAKAMVLNPQDETRKIYDTAIQGKLTAKRQAQQAIEKAMTTKAPEATITLTR